MGEHVDTIYRKRLGDVLARETVLGDKDELMGVLDVGRDEVG